MTMKWIGSTNYQKGRGGEVPRIVVIHVAAGTLSGMGVWFNNPASQVSAHYGIGLKGTIHQYVDEKNTAWANGRVQNPTSTIVKTKGGNPNAYSISIEHEGNDLSKGTKEQWEASRALIDEICERWKIPKDREHVIGHYEIFSGKPSCPATDKSIIDKLISNDEVMIKEFVEAVEAVVGKDYGDNINEKEQVDAAGKLQDVREKLAWAGSTEQTNKRLLENNAELSTKLGLVATEAANLRVALESAKALAEGNAEVTRAWDGFIFFVKTVIKSVK